MARLALIGLLPLGHPAAPRLWPALSFLAAAQTGDAEEEGDARGSLYTAHNHDCLGSATGAPEQPFIGEVTVLEHDWVSSRIAARVLAILLDEVLGYSVRLRMGEKPKDVYRELADGEADLCGEIWPANKRPERKAAASQVDVWMHEVLGYDSWYVPDYVVDQAEPSQNFEFYKHVAKGWAPGFYGAYRPDPAPAAFPRCREAAHDCWPSMRYNSSACVAQGSPETCVSLIHGPVEMSEGMSRDAVEDLQLPVSIAYNTYQSVGDLVWEAFSDAQPVLFHHYYPSEGMHDIPMTRFRRVRMPPGIRSDFTETSLQKAARKGLREDAPDAYNLAQQLTLTNADVELFYRFWRSTGNVDDAACMWVKNNRDRWSSWASLSLRPFWTLPFSLGGTICAAVAAILVMASAHEDSDRSKYQLYRIRGLPFIERICWELGIPTSLVPTLLRDKRSQGRQILSYEAHKVMRLGAFHGAYGTVMREKFVMVSSFCSIGIAAFVGFLGLNVNAVAMQALKQAGVEFSTSIRVLLDFLLALYVSIHIANWWSLRERCVGKLWSSACSTALLLGVQLRSERGRIPEHAEALRKQTAKVIRCYALALEFLFFEARGESHIDDIYDRLRRKGLLADDEELEIRDKENQAQIALSWVGDIMCSLYSEGHLGKDGYASTVVESLNMFTMEGRNAVGRTSAFLSTQIPFGYVQLLSFMVKVFLLSRSVDVGFYLALNMGSGGFQMWTHGLRFLQLVINVIFYQGTLEICDQMRNPFGLRSNCFPMGEFSHNMMTECLELCNTQGGTIRQKTMGVDLHDDVLVQTSLRTTVLNGFNTVIQTGKDVFGMGGDALEISISGGGGEVLGEESTAEPEPPGAEEPEGNDAMLASELAARYRLASVMKPSGPSDEPERTNAA